MSKSLSYSVQFWDKDEKDDVASIFTQWYDLCRVWPERNGQTRSDAPHWLRGSGIQIDHESRSLDGHDLHFKKLKMK